MNIPSEETILQLSSFHRSVVKEKLATLAQAERDWLLEGISIDTEKGTIALPQDHRLMMCTHFVLIIGTVLRKRGDLESLETLNLHLKGNVQGKRVILRCTDLSFLAGLHTLKHLSFAQSIELDDYSFVHQCSGLVSLKIDAYSGASILSPSSLNGHSSLESIELRSHDLLDTVYLENLPKLRSITIGCPVQEVQKIPSSVEEVNIKFNSKYCS